MIYKPLPQQPFNSIFRFMQGYHDIAVTFLRVVGEDLAFCLLEQLSINHIRFVPSYTSFSYLLVSMDG